MMVKRFLIPTVVTVVVTAVVVSITVDEAIEIGRGINPEMIRKTVGINRPKARRILR